MATFIELTQINADVMEDLAYRHAFDRAVENNERGVMRSLISLKYHFGEVTKEDLTACVSLNLDISRPTADKLIGRACDLGFVSFKVDENNETRKLYYLPLTVQGKLKLVGELKLQIAKVIEKQAVESTNLTAGEEFLTAPIYFNMADPKCKRMFMERISEKKNEIKFGRQKGVTKNAT